MRKYFLFIMVMILVSSCTGNQNVPYDWCYTLDYTASIDGTSIGTGSWVEGSGLETDSGDLLFVYVNDNYVNWTQAIVKVKFPVSVAVPLTVQGGFFGTTIPYTNVTVDTTYQTDYTAYFYPTQAGASGLTISMTVNTLSIYTLYLQSIEMRGTGTNPFPTNECEGAPTNTPAPTIPPSMDTYTFPFDYDLQDYSYGNFGYGDRGNWLSSHDTATAVVHTNYWSDIGVYGYDVILDVDSVLPSGYVITQVDVNYYSVGSHNSHMYYLNQDGLTAIYSQLLGVGGYNVWNYHTWGGLSVTDPTVRLSYASSYADTSQFIDHVTIHYTDYSITPTPVPSPTPTNAATRTPITFQPTSTITPTAINTPYTSPTPTLTPSMSHTPSPTPTITDTPSSIVVTDDFTDPGPFNPFGFLTDIFDSIMSFLGGIFDLIGKIWNIFVLLIQLIFALIGLLLAWILDALGRLWALLLSFLNTPSIPIPGFPMCVSAPLDHQLCALYYILDWTFLAPETYGSFIVPMVLAFMNTILIFRAVRYIFIIIKRGEDVTR